MCALIPVCTVFVPTFPACSRIIVDCEVNTGAWTLMHRFNKASELLGDVMGVRSGMGWCKAAACQDHEHVALQRLAVCLGKPHPCCSMPPGRPSHTPSLALPALYTLQGRWQDVDGALARIYVWLRYSAIRQLTWQRNYNTQVRAGLRSTRPYSAWGQQLGSPGRALWHNLSGLLLAWQRGC